MKDLIVKFKSFIKKKKNQLENKKISKKLKEQDPFIYK